MSAIVSVHYPSKPDGTFDEDYYLNVHMPIVSAHWGGKGLVSWKIARYVGDAPYVIQCVMEWESSDAFKQAAASEGGATIMADVPKFTNITPIITVSDVFGSS